MCQRLLLEHHGKAIGVTEDDDVAVWAIPNTPSLLPMLQALLLSLGLSPGPLPKAMKGIDGFPEASYVDGRVGTYFR